MNKKICTKCQIGKTIEDFHPNKRIKSGLNSQCRVCVNKLRMEKYRKNKTEFNKNRYEKNKEKLKEKSRKYRSENKEKLNLKRKEYNLKNKEKVNKKRRERWQKNKEEFNKKRREEYQNNKKSINVRRNKSVQLKKKTDQVFKAKMAIKSFIHNVLRKKDTKKKNTSEQILGLSTKKFILYLESKFESWMNWGNYGKYNGELNFGWDIDHIIPLSSAKTEQEVVALNHFTNLQPLCSKINRDVKRNKF